MPIWKLPAESVPVAADASAPTAVPTLFIDRDGVVIADRDYLADPAGVEILPGVPAALARARAAGYRLVAVTNQSGIGRGYFTEADFDGVMRRLVAGLAASGAAFDAVHFCPHAPADGCACRKPRRGLLDEAGAAAAWDPTRSWVIGDKWSDVALGVGAGLGAILVRTGYGAGQEQAVREQWPDEPRVQVVADLPAAIALVLAAEERER